jgi:hypothetical protein
MREIVTYKDFVQRKESALSEIRTFAAREPATAPVNADPMIDVNKPDSFQSKLLKLIPSEIVGVYLTIFGIIKSTYGEITFNDTSGIIIWVVFGILLIMTPLYLKFVMKITKGMQIALTTLGFIIWVLTIGGPFSTLEPGDSKLIPLLGAILLPIYTLFIPFVFPGEEKPKP